MSLRAVARDLGMVSSAVYRYVPNRDALLTMLIIDAYDSLGEAVEKAERAMSRDDYLGRFLAACHGVRNWALAHPQEYALIYGSPVPGYAAPEDTIAPASRVPTVLITILVDIEVAGRAPAAAVDPVVRRQLAPSGSSSTDSFRTTCCSAGIAAWSGLFGAVSFEFGGHLHNVVADRVKVRKAYFDHQMRGSAAGPRAGGRLHESARRRTGRAVRITRRSGGLARGAHHTKSTGVWAVTTRRAHPSHEGKGSVARL